MNNTSPLLTVNHFDLAFQCENTLEQIIFDLSFTISAGQTVALVGESGTGKSITALAIMQLLPSGARMGKRSQIMLGAQDLLTLTQAQMQTIRGKKIAMIFQEAITALNSVLTIEQQIDEVLKAHTSLSKTQRKQRVLQLLDDVGIADVNYTAYSYPHQLSGGMRQRAMIAMALAGEPELLIADEPTTALDVTLQAQVITLLQDIQQKRNMGMLFITHDLAVVSTIADEIVVMQHGKAVEKNSAKQFFIQPQHDYSQKLLAAIPSWKDLCAVDVSKIKQQINLLTVKQLEVYFPIKKGLLKRTIGHIKAVDDISISIDQGKTLALVGESGSGKTTVGHALVNLVKPTSGNIQYTNIHDLRKDLQIVFQDPYSSLNPRMVVGDIIAEGMKSQRLYKSSEKRRQRVTELLELVGLQSEFQHRYPHQFSGGQRQRICIARALAVNPKLIVCDEPTSALDVSVQKQVLDLLKKLQQELAISYLLITHNFGVVAYMAHDVAVMHNGKIVEQGPTKDILFRPSQQYTKQLLAAVPTLPSMI